MTSKESDAALALCEAATEGPWEEEPEDYESPYIAPGHYQPPMIVVKDLTTGYIREIATMRIGLAETETNQEFIAHARTALPDAIKTLQEAAEIIRNRCPGCANGIDIVKWSPGVFVHRGGTASCKCTDAEREWLARWDGEPEAGKHG